MDKLKIFFKKHEFLIAVILSFVTIPCVSIMINASPMIMLSISGIFVPFLYLISHFGSRPLIDRKYKKVRIFNLVLTLIIIFLAFINIKYIRGIEYTHQEVTEWSNNIDYTFEKTDRGNLVINIKGNYTSIYYVDETDTDGLLYISGKYDMFGYPISSYFSVKSKNDTIYKRLSNRVF